VTGLFEPSRPVAPPAGDGEWLRVHPLTPLIRFWQGIVVLLLVSFRDIGQQLLPQLSGQEGSDGGPPDLGGLGNRTLVIAAAVIVGLLVIGGLAVWLSWRMTRYRVGHDVVELRHGVVFRRQRRARLDRLQAVDVVQPLLARITGLARVSIDVAGGNDAKVQIGYLTAAQAQELRNHLMAASAGLRYDTPAAPEAPETRMLEISTGRLLASVALSAEVAGTLLLVAVLVGVSVYIGNPGPLAPALPALIGAGSVQWRRFSGGFGFRAAASPDGLRLRHGLLEHRSQTVPPGRVQAVRLLQPLLWRPFGWWRVVVNVAGYGHQSANDESGGDSTLLPVGTRDEAIAVLSFVLPDLGTAVADEARAVIDAALVGSGRGQGFVTSPTVARWLDWVSWRRNGFRVTETALLVRHGGWRRQLDVVPHARTQSLAVTRGPLQKLLGLASVRLHSTVGPVAPTVRHLSESVAADLLTGQARRARRARLEDPTVGRTTLPGPFVPPPAAAS
jgi:putative membrane protein